ncbi:hypothetical protein KQI65_00175 [bacterium]|nr:hypothetical protein [bacterium]
MKVNYTRLAHALFALLGLQFLIVLAYAKTLNIDVAQYITMARMILDGALPFRDVFDTNPPTIMYLSVIPVWIGNWTGLDIVRSAHVAVTLFLAGTGWLTAYAMRFLQLPDRPAATRVFAAVWILLAVYVLHMGDFGQRDHLIIAAMFPYAFLRMVAMRERALPLPAEFAAAALLALALLLKPMYGALPLVFEMAVLLRLGMRKYLRHLRIVLIAAVLGILAVALSEAMRLYVTDWWGLIIRYHRSYGYDIWELLKELCQEQVFHFSLVIFAAALLLYRGMKARGLRDLLLAVMLLTVGAFLGMLLQGKGWNYHYIPSIYGFCVLTAMVLLVALQHVEHWKLPMEKGVFGIVLLFAILQLALFPTITSWLRISPPRAPSTPLQQVIEHNTHPDDYVVVVNPGIEFGFPAITQSGRRYGSRYLLAFPLVMGYGGQPAQRVREERKWFVDKYRQELWSDIERTRPELVLVDSTRARWFLPDTMSALTWLQAEGFFLDGPGIAYAPLEGVAGRLAVFKRRTDMDTSGVHAKAVEE